MRYASQNPYVLTVGIRTSLKKNYIRVYFVKKTQLYNIKFGLFVKNKQTKIN